MWGFLMSGVGEGLYLVFVYYESSGGVGSFGGDVAILGNQMFTSDLMK